MEKCFLCSVKVSGEGDDTKHCDSVYWADVRGSMPDLVQAVGRTLRRQPGEGKVASLVVPVIYAREHGDLKVPFTFRLPVVDGQEAEAEGWPTSLANFPLGQWIADARRFYACGDMDTDRIKQLEKPGMVWSHFDVAWEEAWTPPAVGLPRTGTSSPRWTPPIRGRRWASG